MGKLKRTMRRAVRKCKRGVKKCVATVMRKPMEWYEQDAENRVTFTRTEDYELDQQGLLTVQKKKEVMRALFKRYVGYVPNVDHPRSFNEKIMWLKLNYQNPAITRCCDKFSVKGYVTEVLGPEFVVPTIDWWTNADDIDFDKLPDKFVLKVNWSSGMNIIVPDKSKLDVEEARRKIRKWLTPSQNSYYQLFNWGYKYITPVVYAEEYISEIGDSTQIYDYKFYCYRGKCGTMFITTDRFTRKTYNYFDRDFNEIPATWGRVGKTPGGVKKPKHYEEMVAWAEKLCKPFPFARADFYEIGDRVMVGEMTFYAGGGILKFTPREWDFKLGELNTLPDPMEFESLRAFEDRPSAKENYLLEKTITMQEKQHYCEQMGFGQLLYWPDLSKPKTLSEKLMWLALHYQNPLIARVNDKYEMKGYVAERVGEQYLVPTIGLYEDMNDIDWTALPDRFAVKSTASRNGDRVQLVTEKAYRSEGVLKTNLAQWLYPWNTYYYENMCITDQKIKPRILFEELVGGEAGPAKYAFYCIFGEPKLALVPCAGSVPGAKQRSTFVDAATWQASPFLRHDVDKAPPAARPAGHKEMMDLSRKLAGDLPLVAVEFYDCGGKLYVSRISTDDALFTRFEPVEFDPRLGELIDLEKVDRACLR